MRIVPLTCAPKSSSRDVWVLTQTPKTPATPVSMRIGRFPAGNAAVGHKPPISCTHADSCSSFSRLKTLESSIRDDAVVTR